MLRVGITGGIGSGKSTVCQVFSTLGIPVFYADEAARLLINSDANLIISIKEIFGNDIYTSGQLDRAKVAAAVFNSPALLQQMNALIHPATIRYGLQWMNSQQSPYAIKEAAIFFESGSYKDMDVMVGVYAPLELRIRRAMQRDDVTMEKIQARIAAQMNEEEKMARCNYVITNDDVTAIIPQVLELHHELLQRADFSVA